MKIIAFGKRASSIFPRGSTTNSFLSNHYITKIKTPFVPFHREMSKTSKYEYVKKFETDDRLLPHCWMIVRIDGKAFHRFSDTHEFSKPNDLNALSLMNAVAEHVMSEFTDIVLCYGQSDEYSFVFRPRTELYGRRSAKITTNIVSLFASTYVFKWNEFFPNKSLKYPPSFDGRAVLYPTNETLRDYLSWRQVDCHINNLYNTVFWALVQQGNLSNHEAQERLKGSVSGDKNEILFSEFNINYNNEPEQFKKGTTIIRKKIEIPIDADSNQEIQSFGAQDKPKTEVQDKHEKNQTSKEIKKQKIENQAKIKIRTKITHLYCDIIRDDFWKENKGILEY